MSSLVSTYNIEMTLFIIFVYNVINECDDVKG